MLTARLEQLAYVAGRVVRHRLEDAATGLDRATTADARWRQLLCGVVLRHTGPWKTIRGGIVCPKCGAKFVWAKPAMAKNLDGVALIAAERRRQIDEEGWSMAHDASCHNNGQLVHAAMAYLALVVGRVELSNILWPWEGLPKKHDPLRSLAVAGALIAAEIDRRHGAPAAPIKA